MPRLTKEEAIEIAKKYDIPLQQDFHGLPSATVARIQEAANSRKYRPYSTASGSRNRYFYYYLCRTARREDGRI